MKRELIEEIAKSLSEGVPKTIPSLEQEPPKELWDSINALTRGFLMLNGEEDNLVGCTTLHHTHRLPGSDDTETYYYHTFFLQK
jgi:hypothetical protein